MTDRLIVRRGYRNRNEKIVAKTFHCHCDRWSSRVGRVIKWPLLSLVYTILPINIYTPSQKKTTNHMTLI
jgi:hypothetical protein